MPEWHARLGPSSMERILICNESAVLGGDDDAGAAADEGTLAHSFCERILNGDDNAADEIPDDEMRAAVFKYVAYVRAFRSHDELDGVNHTNSKVHVELQIRSESIKDFGGTMDTLIVSDEHLHTIDFKYGMIPVDARDNKQVLSYLVLADEKFPGRKRFFGTIVQPRVFGDPQCMEYTYAQLIDHKYNVMMVDELNNGKTAGGHCKWCPLKKTCTTLDDHLVQVAKEEFDDLDVVKELTPERCIEIIDMQPVFSKMVEEAKVRLKKFLLDGATVPGWRLAQSLGNRVWRDPDEVKRFMKTKKTPPEVYLETKLKSPAQIEKFSKAYVPLVAELTVRPDRGAIAVEDTSKLPEYIRPEDQFDDL